jgi:threonine dehydrogenase-like Zn-dependent dehydrogenase
VIEKLMEITNGDLPTVVIDATGNLKAIETGFSYMAHGARYVLVGLQKEAVHFSHPEFHKKEATLMSSRNANKQDFAIVMESMKSGKINPANYITHRIAFDSLTQQFASLSVPENGVIKAMVELD